MSLPRITSKLDFVSSVIAVLVGGGGGGQNQDNLCKMKCTVPNLLGLYPNIWVGPMNPTSRDWVMVAVVVGV